MSDDLKTDGRGEATGGVPGGVPGPEKGPLPPVAASPGSDDLLYEDDVPPEELDPAPWKGVFGGRKPKPRALVKPEDAKPAMPAADPKSAEWRLLILDTWTRSKLPAGDFVAMLGGIVEKHTLYDWKKRFLEEGPAGLVDKPRGGRPKTRLALATERAILMMKEAHPEWGSQRIADELVRGPGMSACPATVLKVLHGSGYEAVEVPTKPHGEEPKRFERAAPNQLWQTDLFTFMLKRQNRRVHLVAFLDDHSRFIVSYGLHATSSSALVMEVLRAGIASYGLPKEVLSDNGPQYKTWRGKSRFSRELERHGIEHVVAAPRHPQTLGKIERFWGTLWEECVGTTVFVDLDDARARLGHFIDYYNFKRPHQGIQGLVPADRFFGAVPEVKATLAARVAANALELAKEGVPRKPFYVTGLVGGKGFSVHAEGERMILTQDGKKREEVELVAPEGPAPAMPQPVTPAGISGESPADAGNEEEDAPGTSPLDEGLSKIRETLEGDGHERS